MYWSEAASICNTRMGWEGGHMHWSEAASICNTNGMGGGGICIGLRQPLSVTQEWDRGDICIGLRQPVSVTQEWDRGGHMPWSEAASICNTRMG